MTFPGFFVFPAALVRLRQLRLQTRGLRRIRDALREEEEQELPEPLRAGRRLARHQAAEQGQAERREGQEGQGMVHKSSLSDSNSDLNWNCN